MRIGRVEEDRSTAWDAIAVLMSATTASLVPLFLVAALMPRMAETFEGGIGALSVAVSAFFIATAAGAPVAVWLIDRHAAATVLRASTALAAIATAGVAGAQDTPVVVVCLALAGVSHAAAYPAAGRLLASGVAARRRSLAAGLVGASVAAAPPLCGALAAALGPPFNWRGCMLVAAALLLLGAAAPVYAARGQGGARRARETLSRRDRATLVLWCVAALLGAIASNVAAIFMVTLGVRAGLGGPTAAVVYSVAGVVSLCVRIAAGAFVDRRAADPVRSMALLMCLGTIGLVAMSSSNEVVFVAGALFAAGTAQGWTGLLLSGTVRMFPRAPAMGGAAVQMWVYVGCAASPLGVALVADALSWRAAVFCAAVCGAVGAGLALTAANRAAGAAPSAVRVA
jgi:predicted MFS family arabinose efflux permease